MSATSQLSGLLWQVDDGGYRVMPHGSVRSVRLTPNGESDRADKRLWAALSDLCSSDVALLGYWCGPRTFVPLAFDMSAAQLDDEGRNGDWQGAE